MRKSPSSDIPTNPVMPPTARPGTRELGPSDLSDTGSDTIGTAADLDNDSDAAGTGEGRDAGGANVAEGFDLRPDRVISADDMGDASADE